MTPKEFESARLYSRDKSSFNFVANLYSLLQTVLVFQYDFLPWAWKYSETVLEKLGYSYSGEITQSLVFTGILVLLSTLLSLPTSLYFTFVIEQKHGFNKQTLLLYITDTLKTLALTAIIGAPVLSAFLYIVHSTGELFYWYLWLFMVAFQLIMMNVFPTWIQPLFNKYTPLEDGPLKQKIDALAARIKFPLTKVFLVDGSKRSSHSNAYFFGFFNNKRIVIFDTLLEDASHDEICSVLAHELGHWNFNHVLKNLLIAQAHMLLMFYLFSFVINLEAIYLAFGFTARPTIIGFMLFQFVFTPVESLVGFLMHILSRAFEFQADAFAAGLGYSELLAKSLIKINRKNKGNMNPDKLYSVWYYSHPPLIERLGALEKLSAKKK